MAAYNVLIVNREHSANHQWPPAPMTDEALEHARQDMITKGLIAIKLPDGSRVMSPVTPDSVRVTPRGLEMTLEVPAGTLT